MKQNENLTEINLGQENYEDFRGSLYFRAFRVEDQKYTIKHAKLEDGTVLPLVHVEGIQVTTGKFVNFDMWPRNSATAEDLKALPDGTVLEDVDFRVGYLIKTRFNEETGEEEKYIARQGAPKWLAAFIDNKKIKLSGDYRKYVAEA